MLKKTYQKTCLAYIGEKNDTTLLDLYPVYRDQTAFDFSTKIIVPEMFIKTDQQRQHLDRYPLAHVYLVTDIIHSSAMEIFEMLYWERGWLSIYEIINITADNNIWFNGFFLPNEG